MTASCEVPLTKTEIQLGVYISLGGDPSQGCERILLNVCRRCGPIIEEVEGYIQFVHFTAHEYARIPRSTRWFWLINSCRYLLASLGNRSQYLNEAETHGDISLMSLNYLNSSCFDTDLSEAEFHGYIIRGTFVLENYVATYWISHLKKSEYAHSRARIQLAAETLIMSRQNPLFAAFAPSDNDISDFQFIGDFCYDVATAFGFCKMRKRDLCFSDGKSNRALVSRHDTAS
jgi:hypothetical protein